MRRILIINRGADTGGGSIKIKRAFAKYAPRWQVRCVRTWDNYIGYPADFVWDGSPNSTETLRMLWRWASVVHMVGDERLSRQFEHYHDKPKVIHFRGRGPWRDRPDILDSIQARGIPAIVSTPNLLAARPSYLEWMPNLCDIGAMQALRRQHYRPHSKPLAIHAPTVRALKATDAFVAGLEPLRDRVDLDLIEGVTLDECLARKAKGDLLLDQLEVAYGSNAIEAWGMGMPVVCGIASPFMDKWYRTVPGYVPFADATPATVTETVAALLDDPEEVTQRGITYVHDFHREEVVVRKLQALYERVLQ